jgi:DNA polymerase-1
MIKVAMVRIHEDIRRKGLKSRMVLQVHDELVFDAYKPELKELEELVADRMKHALALKVPIEVGMGHGENWLEAH